MNQSMTDYLRDMLGLEAEAATALRQRYWRRYGATLLGLMRHHGTDPRHFLWHTHQFPELKRMLVREPLLRSTAAEAARAQGSFLQRPGALPARRAESPWHRRPLRCSLLDREHAAIGPSPIVGGFLRFVRANRLHPRRCIMVEDTLANLRTAKKLGMKTVWVSRDRRVPRYVDLRIENLSELRRHLTQLA